MHEALSNFLNTQIAYKFIINIIMCLNYQVKYHEACLCTQKHKVCVCVIYFLIYFKYQK